MRAWRFLFGAAILGIVALTGCSHDSLPQQDSYQAQLYVKRCGGCHVAYQPRSMTAAMWQIKVDAMQPKMQQAGIAPLTDDQRAAILDYLDRNAGQQ